MTSELTHKDLSDWVYRLDPIHEDYFTIEVGDVRKFGGIKHQILQVEDNTTNGMQAMAVAPVVNGKVDTSEVVIAYAGTNPKDHEVFEINRVCEWKISLVKQG